MTDDNDKPRRDGGEKRGFTRDSNRGPRPKDGSGPRFRDKESSTSRSRDRDAPKRDADTPEGERIAKRLARAGISSRRDAELLILDGRVSVNGKVLQSPAVNVLPSDKIAVDGQMLPEIERTRLWLYHKPAGLVTTAKDPEGRPTVFDALPEGLPRVISVGRLDINTEGLLLLTNDGGLARTLELPTTGWLRRYRVRAFGKVKQEQLDSLKDGVAVDGVFYGAVEALLEREQGSNVWITIGLREGKNREVKNILGSLGLEVNRLIRISFGPFQMGELEEGAVLEVNGRTLRDQLGDKLIEESGANFEAPVINAFSNQPVRGEKPVEREWTAHRRSGDWVGGTENPIVKRQFKKKPEPIAAEKPRATRGANVWMAPGSRPKSEKKIAEDEANSKASSERSSEFRPGRRERADGGRPQGERKPFGERPQGKRKPYRESAEGERKPFGERPQGDRKPYRERAEGERKPFGERPQGDRKPYRERVEGERKPFGERPQGERKSFSDRPQGERKPYGDRPQRERKPFGGRAAGESTATGDTAHGERKPWNNEERPRTPRADRPDGPRPERRDGKPGGFKGGKSGGSFGSKPGGGKSFGGKPGGSRPGGSRPSGGKPRSRG